MAEFTAEKSKKLDRLDEIIRGNGAIGMRAQVKYMAEYMADIKSAIKWLVRLVGAGLLLQILSAVGLIQ